MRSALALFTLVLSLALAGCGDIGATPSVPQYGSGPRLELPGGPYLKPLPPTPTVTIR